MPFLEPVGVELRSRLCHVCHGTGWMPAPGIGKRAYICGCRCGCRTVTISRAEWDALGNPKDIEEYGIKVAEKAKEGV